MNMNQRFNRNYNNRGYRGRAGNNRGGFGRGNRGSWGQQNFRGSFPQGRGSFRRGNFTQDNPAQGYMKVEQWNKPKRDTPGKRLCESDIGVTEYISDHSGFNGIIKSRYSDFQVSEISKEGHEAILTDLKPPKPPVDVVDEDEELLLTKYNVEILPLETWDNINKIAVCQEETTETVEIDVTGMTKEQRTKIHEAVKKAFGSSVIGSTVSVDDKKYVRFEKYRKGVRVDTRVKWIWPGEYVYFVVYKENCDTMEAASLIAERLRMNLRPSTICFAGTKDRRAKTSQWMSMRRVQPASLARASAQLRALRLGNYKFLHEPLRLGMLSGNRFQIALRNVTAPEETIETACKQLVEKGFLNYYGLQRFGTRIGVPTYQIGLKLLLGQYQEAIELILDGREGPLQECLSVYRQSGARAALAALPAARAAPEARLLRSLAAAPADALRALSQVPRNTRLLYLHAYQSLVWNRAVSERLRRFGRTPAVGDLVLCGAAPAEVLEEVEESDDSESEDSGVTPTGESKDNEPDKNADKEDKTTEQPKPKEKKQNKDEPKEKIPVKILTQEDIDRGVYTIFDIVMPLPGYNIDYPPNMKDFYEELLKKDGLELTLRNKHKSYSMSGAYRAVVARPSATTWRLARYSEPRGDLLPSQLDALLGAAPPGPAPDGKFRALLLDMTLPASCYATMALRELMKVDTSVDNQAQQNDYYKTENEDNGESTNADSNGSQTVKDEVDETDEGVVKTENGTNGEATESGSGSEKQVDKRKLEDEKHEEAKKAKIGESD